MPSKRHATGRQHLRAARGSDPEARLVGAVLELAAVDATSPDQALALEARRFLLGPVGRAWLAWLDLEPGAILDWCRRLPPPGQRTAA